MTVIASVSIPAEEFVLGSLLERDAETAVTVETTVPTSETVVPYLWVPNGSIDGVLRRLEELPVVRSGTVLDEVDDYSLVRIEWNGEVNGVLESIRETDAIVTGAVGTGEAWTFRLRFPSHEDLSAFYTACVDREISVELGQVHETLEAEAASRFGLTDAQRDILVAAHRAGYFEVPRRTTLVELGESLEISDSAVSQRLRRGLDSLVAATLLEDPASQSDLRR